MSKFKLTYMSFHRLAKILTLSPSLKVASTSYWSNFSRSLPLNPRIASIFKSVIAWSFGKKSISLRITWKLKRGSLIDFLRNLLLAVETG